MLKRTIHPLIFFIAIFISLAIATFFVWKQTAYIPSFSIPSTNKQLETTGDINNYAVESEGDTLDEKTETNIEQDIDQLSPEDENTQDMEELEIIPTEDQDDAISTPEPPAQFKTPLSHNDNKLRIGFITDIHSASESITGNLAFSQSFIDAINSFLRKMNDNFGPDMIINGGDIIEGTQVSSSQGKAELSRIKKLFDQTAIKKYWVLGNHDLRSIKKSQWKEALDIDYTRTSFKLKGYKIIILDSNFDNNGNNVYPGNGFTRGNVSDEEMTWLEKELSSSEKKIIFIHHPPLRGISSTPNSNLIKNANELKSLFSEGNVLAVFSGHIEDLYSEEDAGVKYFVFPGFTKNPTYPGAFVNITIDGNKITEQMSYFGKDGNYKTIDIKKVETK